MNYRGAPSTPELGHHEALAETVRSGAEAEDEEEGGGQLEHRLGLAASPGLAPGSGSWMFNSIEARARHGLSPTHVPSHAAKQGLETYSISFTIDSPMSMYCCRGDGGRG